MVNIGIYCITCTVNGRVYFGSSSNLKRRLATHRQRLDKNGHVNPHLQLDWNLYGSKSFEFKILLRHSLSKYKLLELESIFIHNYWDEQICCYNIALDARAPRRGCSLSDKTKAKLSRAAMGNTYCLGRQVSEETRTKISQGHQGLKASEATKVKIAQAQIGRRASDEARAHMSLAMKGQKRSLGHTHSEETRTKISLSCKAARAKKQSLFEVELA